MRTHEGRKSSIPVPLGSFRSAGWSANSVHTAYREGTSKARVTGRACFIVQPFNSVRNTTIFGASIGPHQSSVGKRDLIIGESSPTYSCLMYRVETERHVRLHWNVFGYGAELIALVLHTDIISMILKTDGHHRHPRSGCAEGARRDCGSPHMHSPALFTITMFITSSRFFNSFIDLTWLANIYDVKYFSKHTKGRTRGNWSISMSALVLLVLEEIC